MRRSFVLLALVVAGACAKDRTADSPAYTIQMLPVDSVAAARLPHRGSVVQVAHWRDHLGDHMLLLAQTGAFPTPGDAPYPGELASRDAELRVYDYVAGAPDGKPLWHTIDYVRDCPMDIYAGFVPGSLTVTDLDSNGIAEVTFLYTLSCRSDVSPATRKLIMHEGAQKYAIRGTTLLPKGYGGGEMRLDPSFQKSPSAFRSYAVKQWKRFVAYDPFDQF